MSWPWVTRAALEAAEARARSAESTQRSAEDRCVLAEAEIGALRKELADVRAAWEAERKQLTDRILVQSGGSPLYQAPQTPQPPPVLPMHAQNPAEGPLPRVRITFDDVHAKAKQAMQNGTFDLQKGRSY